MSWNLFLTAFVTVHFMYISGNILSDTVCGYSSCPLGGAHRSMHPSCASWLVRGSCWRCWERSARTTWAMSAPSLTVGVREQQLSGSCCPGPCANCASVPPVLPGLGQKPALLALWCDFSGSVGLFHASLDHVLKHMHLCFGPALEEKRQNAADTGTITSYRYWYRHLRIKVLGSSRRGTFVVPGHFNMSLSHCTRRNCNLCAK